MVKVVKWLNAALLLVSAQMAQAAGVMVENPWVSEAPPGATALAGYMIVHNHGEADRMLVGAESPAFGSVMLHRTVMEDGMAKMVHQHMITIPAGGSVVFEPNSYHLMMMSPKGELKAGDQVEVTLQFKNGENLTIQHQVRAREGMGGMDHGAMDHGSMEQGTMDGAAMDHSGHMSH